MSLTLKKKQATVRKIHDQVKCASSMVIANFRNITANTINHLRKDSRSLNINIHVVKNRLIPYIIKDTSFALLHRVITEPTLLILSKEHPGFIVNLLKKFTNNNNLVIKVVAFQKQVLSPTIVDKLMTLLTIPAAISALLFIIKEVTIGKFIQVLTQIQKKINK